MAIVISFLVPLISLCALAFSIWNFITLRRRSRQDVELDYAEKKNELIEVINNLELKLTASRENLARLFDVLYAHDYVRDSASFAGLKEKLNRVYEQANSSLKRTREEVLKLGATGKTHNERLILVDKYQAQVRALPFNLFQSITPEQLERQLERMQPAIDEANAKGLNWKPILEEMFKETIVNLHLPIGR